MKHSDVHDTQAEQRKRIPRRVRAVDEAGGFSCPPLRLPFSPPARRSAIANQEGELLGPFIESKPLFPIIAIEIIDAGNSSRGSANVIEDRFCHLDWNAKGLKVRRSGPTEIVEPPRNQFDSGWILAALGRPRLEN